MRRTESVHAFTKLTGSLALVTAAGVASAQEAALEEVIVTAQKRAQSLQEVPIAVSAFDAGDLDSMGAVSMEQVARNTPNLFFNQSDSIKSSRTNIRGISPIGSTAGADPSVGYYLDEVYLGSSVGNFMDLYDVERIEVLRGPQGTLFGRNTIGGVISVTSRRPGDTPRGSIDAQFGNYNLMRFKGSLSGPIVPGKLAASISGVYYDRKGYLYNVNLGNDTNDAHQYGARLALLFTPSESAEFLLSIDTRKVDQTAQSQETLINDDNSLLGSFGLLVNRNPTDRKVYGAYIGREELKNAWGGSLRARFSLPGVDVISVSGYRTHDYHVEGESDQIPFGIGRNFDPESVDRFTQELRVESTGDGPLQWIAGVYYYNQDSSNDGGILIENDLLSLFGAGFLGEVSGGSRGRIDARSIAGFANLEYSITPALQLAVGGRYTSEKKKLQWVQEDLEALFGDPILGGTGSATGKDKWKKFTPAANIRYHVNDDAMVYGTVSKGFKGGGYNDGSGVPSQAGLSYDPETLMNYEIGLKSTWFDDRVRLNVAAFLMRWKDIQVRADDPSTPSSFDPRVINAGKAHSNGIEVELSALLTRNFRVDLNAALLDTGYDEGTIPVSSGTPVELTHFARAPKRSFGVNAEYAVPVGETVDLKIRGEYQYQSKVFFNLDPRDPYSGESGYGLLNARVTLAAKDDRWRISVWGMNLADKTYRVAAFDLLSNPLVSQYFSMLGAPRTYGVDLHYGF